MQALEGRVQVQEAALQHTLLGIPKGCHQGMGPHMGPRTPRWDIVRLLRTRPWALGLTCTTGTQSRESPCGTRWSGGSSQGTPRHSARTFENTCENTRSGSYMWAKIKTAAILGSGCRPGPRLVHRPYRSASQVAKACSAQVAKASSAQAAKAYGLPIATPSNDRVDMGFRVLHMVLHRPLDTLLLVLVGLVEAPHGLASPPSTTQRPMRSTGGIRRGFRIRTRRSGG